MPWIGPRICTPWGELSWYLMNVATSRARKVVASISAT